MLGEGGQRYNCAVAIIDLWEGVPPDQRLDFKVIREPIERLTAAVVINVERSLPPPIATVPGAPYALLLMTKVAQTTSARSATSAPKNQKIRPGGFRLLRRPRHCSARCSTRFTP